MPGFGPGISTPSAPSGSGFGSGSGHDSRSSPFRSFRSTPTRGAELTSAHLGQFVPVASRESALILTNISPAILRRIFAFVCPHSQDETYDNCEDSAIGEACMLCDMRDLAHCAAVSRAWRIEAVKVL